MCSSSFALTHQFTCGTMGRDKINTLQVNTALYKKIDLYTCCILFVHVIARLLDSCMKTVWNNIFMGTKFASN